ncbi:Vacuolar-processing enzyme precursor, putative [Perkinsus marinus ATCC 50983]|uniref:Vacuolar-processing enzyme, putative n=1 Tax=Perkinsus marinus (strain ATCC 50983 / TXsc) TaxID=423536 RepID=C5KMX8_PERM5|nr:Vacuolar-processing enzyme precursor, putative [Perkinsus marinus ATCC 50983]EER14286.1 Vacuolar-processing enzyme precursor, putative [Perkinsus marinus ATCC 50983]|eukprot:XP_002782491.1 Vacuolar-processing enzyme precursor, putative [Perkinsus marinus ATCC 50983]
MLFSAILSIGYSLSQDKNVSVDNDIPANHWAVSAVIEGIIISFERQVLIAGSNTYWNYRHQADVCHAYQILRRNGVPKEHIITLSYNDIVNHTKNPFKGQLFNKPTGDRPGVDVYKGCEIDYSGEEVTVKNVQGVLTGDKSLASKKVLESTENDYVFINFVDHGATSIMVDDHGEEEDVACNSTVIRATHKLSFRYKQLVFYVETCESGSLFEGNPPIPGQYYVTASNPHESSFATYCPPHDKVANVSLNACLGDLFSVNWMENEDAFSHTGRDETLEQQYHLVKKETNSSQVCFALSHVKKYGDGTFTNESTQNFMGSRNGKIKLVGSDYAPGSEATVEHVFREFFGRPKPQGMTVEEEVAREKERLRAIKQVSSVPSRMIAIHIKYSELREEEGKPSNYRRQLEVAKELLQTVEERIREVEQMMDRNQQRDLAQS